MNSGGCGIFFNERRQLLLDAEFFARGTKRNLYGPGFGYAVHLANQVEAVAVALPDPQVQAFAS